MRIDLTGNKALISGSTGGIGFAIAKGLARAGASVVVNGRTQARCAGRGPWPRSRRRSQALS